MDDQEKVSSRYDIWTPFYDIIDNVPLISGPQKRWKEAAVRSLDLKGDEKEIGRAHV